MLRHNATLLCDSLHSSDLRAVLNNCSYLTSSRTAPSYPPGHNAMNRSSSSHSRSHQSMRSSSFAPSLRRRATSLSTAHPSNPSGDPEAAQTEHTDHVIHEEIAEIKRYEDFTTIDWVQDAAREQLRRKARRKERR